ncbi:hypothetical protein E1B28_010322 [Marasmius oreades]|uniref:MYND-type domain-containing protein n=1 Tax=Marasmius oreades TaxID=181124 RepID=A0A9P7RX30_9AGAR|nr:uncharacterized protein E1B28_010322 [Marasmius oreades]KAG7091272.1 hypothetical protein E1B28_010322 [Marasmius oreades]
MDDDIINGFMFCEPHGSEYCNVCCRDHRMCNNIRIESELAKAFPGISEEQLMDRPPLSNVIKGKAISKQCDAEREPLYQCTTHNKVDCDACFDWGKLVVAEFRRVASTFGKEIPVDLTRDEKMGLLASMGIELPQTTRLPDDALEKKLRNTIDAAQYFKDVIAKAPIDPATLPLWPLRSSSKSLSQATARGNLGEGLGRDGILKSRGDVPSSSYEKTFLALRVIVGELAKGMDDGVQSLVLQDEEQSNAILIRVVEVRKANSTVDEVPVLFVLYTHNTQHTPILQAADWFADLVAKGGQSIQITAPVEVQKLFLAFLHLNSKRISPSYRPTRRAYESHFVPSFIIPIGPISSMEIGSLTKSAGCVLCGKKTFKKCSGCLAADYCGPECQKAHWKEHKVTCKSLKGGTWRTVELGTANDLFSELTGSGQGQDMFFSTLNFQDPLRGRNSASIKSSSSTPPNIHGNTPFLVKIQRSMGSDNDPMLVYDRQKSFQMQLIRSKDVGSHTEALRQMNDSATGLKIYRWAKRIGDLQFSICFDRPPPSDPLW